MKQSALKRRERRAPNPNGIQIRPSAQGWHPLRTGKERGIYAASTSANQHAQKYSNALASPHVEAT
jgi:hypothetical protein